MSQSQTTFLPKYLATVFIAKLPELLPARFGVITAYNPKGRLAADEVNIEADVKLKGRLNELKLRHFRVTGVSEDCSHQEPGFGVVVDDPKYMEALALEFQQEAFFWIRDCEVYCIKVEDSTLHRVGRWQDRQLKHD
jgi:hypothetical protein